MKVVVTKEGVIRMIAPDNPSKAIPDKCVRVSIYRASHIEPHGFGWLADLSPVCGPTLGPFESRSDAVEAELAWLSENLEKIQKRETYDS